jgi:alpha-N-arabinofuranosidase
VELRGATPKAVSGTILSSASMQDHNTFEKPDTVTLKEFAGAVISGSKVILTMPSKSLVTIELQ